MCFFGTFTVPPTIEIVRHGEDLVGGGDGPEGPRQGDRARGQQEAGAVAMMALRASVRALRDLEEELAVQGTRMAVVLREKERLEEQLQEATDTVEVWQ